MLLRNFAPHTFKGMGCSRPRMSGKEAQTGKPLDQMWTRTCGAGTIHIGTSAFSAPLRPSPEGPEQHVVPYEHVVWRSVPRAQRPIISEGNTDAGVVHSNSAYPHERNPGWRKLAIGIASYDFASAAEGSLFRGSSRNKPSPVSRNNCPTKPALTMCSF